MLFVQLRVCQCKYIGSTMCSLCIQWTDHCHLAWQGLNIYYTNQMMKYPSDVFCFKSAVPTPCPSLHSDL